ncbi:MAG TPA: alpha/beta hydrolase [Gaiellaceae bacterium]|nr:alpha/beta hydrolase [Gaiellaceae bacterium]
MRVRVDAGIELAVREWGDRGDPPVVLLHGGGLSCAEWTELAPELARDRRVVAFDARGCGASDADPERRYGAATIAADLETVRHALGLERFALVGHSLGAVAACVHAAEHPDAVSALVLLDGGPADRTRPRALEDPVLSFASREDAAATLARSSPHGFPDWYLDTRFETRPDGTLAWRGDFAGRVRWARDGGEPLIPGLWPYVEALRAPTLVLRGAESPLFARQDAVRMAEVNPRVRLVEIPGAGHFVHLDRPELVLAEIRAHLG